MLIQMFPGIFFFFLLRANMLNCADSSGYDALYNDILSGYNKDLLPVRWAGNTTMVSVETGIISINDFDQLSGELSMTTFFNLQWTEERISWDANSYNNIKSMVLPLESIWYPRIFIRESSTQIEEFGASLVSFARLFNNGQVLWKFGAILKVTCPLDVTYFPFDTQTCPITLYSGLYFPQELTLYNPSDEISTTSMHVNNNEWDLVNTAISNQSSVALQLQVQLKRRTVFYVVCIIIPILLLGSISNLVFLLPTHTPERLSVTMTSFVAFVVYMNIVNNNVPESSSPVAYLYCYLLFLMIYSTTSMIISIIAKGIQSKDTDVPYSIQWTTACLRFWCFKPLSATVHPEEDSTPVIELKKCDWNPDVPHGQIEEENSLADLNITWKTVARTFDLYSAIAMITLYYSFSIRTIVCLVRNEGL